MAKFQEYDKFYIPEEIQNMTIDELRKKKKEILIELGKKNMDRYFYTVELSENNQKTVHLSGNVYFNDGSTDSIDCYRLAEWTFFYLTLEEIKLLFEEDLFYEYIDESINYLCNLTEETAKETCRTYFNGTSGTELHIKDVTQDTPCGNYWFE